MLSRRWGDSGQPNRHPPCPQSKLLNERVNKIISDDDKCNEENMRWGGTTWTRQFGGPLGGRMFEQTNRPVLKRSGGRTLRAGKTQEQSYWAVSTLDVFDWWEEAKVLRAERGEGRGEVCQAKVKIPSLNFCSKDKGEQGNRWVTQFDSRVYCYLI